MKTRLRRRVVHRLCWAMLALCLCLGQSWGWTSVAVGGEEPSLNQGLQHYQLGDFQGAIQIWQAELATVPRSTSALKIARLRWLVRAHQQLGQWTAAIAMLEQLRTLYQQQHDHRQVGRLLTELAQIHSALGQYGRALEMLCQPLVTGQSLPTAEGDCVAESAVAIAVKTQDVPGRAAALGALGDVYRLQGRYDLALQWFTQSLDLATTANLTPTMLAALQGVGNTYTNLAGREYRYAQFAQDSQPEQTQLLRQRALRYDQLAMQAFERSLALMAEPADRMNAVRVRLNLIPLYHRNDRAIAKLVQEVQSYLPLLPPSAETVSVLVRFATVSQLVPGADANLDWAIRCPTQPPPPSVVAGLSRAYELAQQIQEPAAISLTLGRLGHVYECRQDYGMALQWTQRAQLAGQNQAGRYLWHWQAARIFKAQGNVREALTAYEMAVDVLKGIRSDLAIAGRDVQFDFRDRVEPIYREYAALQLIQATQISSGIGHPASQLVTTLPVEARGKNSLGEVGMEGLGLDASHNSSLPAALVSSALETIDGLHLAELQNYLGDDCTLEPISKPIALLDPKTAVLSSLLLGDRAALILTRPAGPDHVQSQVRWLPVSPQELTTTVNLLRLQLEKRSDLANGYRQPARQLYDWLIQPFSADLEQVETLVFVQDGILRSIPMATLYDGQRFLMERYAIANTLSLTLVDPTHFDRRNLRVVAFGLTQPALLEGDLAFDGLQDVTAEIQQIIAAIPGSTGIFDRDFTRDRLRQEIVQQANTPIIHLATHGKFGIDSRDTFLVTGQLTESARPSSLPSSAPGIIRHYNEKLTMNQLYAMLRQRQQGNPVELLTLTACETAVGSDRDALGIAGIALQAGARSAIASLWQVDDRSTATLITHFYQGLRQGLSRAKALQQAQISWLKENPGSHPSFWAALILVGTWL